MFRKLLVVAVLLALGGTLYAGPFFQRRNCQGSSCLVQATPSQTSTGPLREFRQEAAPVQQPWLLISAADDSSSLQPDTALEPIGGTGSRLLTGPKVPDKITHVLDGEFLKKLDGLTAGLSQKQGPVSIHLPMDESTSQRLSRILMILEALLYVVPGGWGLSKIGPFLQLAARVVSGLLSALPAALPPPTATVAAPSSTQVSGS